MTQIEQDDHRFFLVMLSEAPLRALAKPFTICVNLSYLCHLCAFSKQPDKLSFKRL